MGGIFYCGACGKRQCGGKRFAVTSSNLGSVRARLSSGVRPELAASVSVGMVLCTVARTVKVDGHVSMWQPCMAEADRSALKASLVGRRVSKLLPKVQGSATDGATGDDDGGPGPPPLVDDDHLNDVSAAHYSFCDGTITAAADAVDAEPGSYSAEFITPTGARTVVLTAAEAEEAVRSFVSLQQLLKAERKRADQAAQHRTKRAEEHAAAEMEQVRARARRVEERTRAEMMADQSNRQMRWPHMLDPAWWSTWGDKVSPSLHRSLFGFPTPSAMRDFFEVFFDEEALLPDEIGLSQYQLYALALLRMRRGDSVQHIAAITGANRGRLGPATDVWIHRLGAVGRMLVGVPDIDYLLESMPTSFIECGMGKTCAVGDATDFMTETVRSAFMKLVRIMQWSDKVHRSAARGTSFCSANGMTIIALALTFGRSSELNCVKACAQWLKLLPSYVHVAYDKGIRGMRSILPNLNFVFMPCFLAPKQGKTQFTVDEAIETRGIARNRYVIEITYKRVKEWHLLKEVVPREKFHLMNSTWLWALGFSNLAQRFLQPPPSVETAEQRTRRLERQRTDAAASAAEMDELRAAAAAAAG